MNTFKYMVIIKKELFCEITYEPTCIDTTRNSVVNKIIRFAISLQHMNSSKKCSRKHGHADTADQPKLQPSSARLVANTSWKLMVIAISFKHNRISHQQIPPTAAASTVGVNSLSDMSFLKLANVSISTKL